MKVITRSYVVLRQLQRSNRLPLLAYVHLSTTPSTAHRKAYNSSLATSSHKSQDSATIQTTNTHTYSPTSTKHDQPGPLEHYYHLIENGTLRGDEHQTRIIQKLQRLHDQLNSYTPPELPSAPSQSSFFSRIFTRPAPPPTTPPSEAPKGLYLFGDVGTGKTMLMDLFFSTLPERVTKKRRVHFHAFMIDVHQRVHAAKKKMGHEGGDPIVVVARDLAEEAKVLCFDEFQVTDIADAMILRRLMEYLLNYGVICVMTSNRHPDDLYKNGIQRSSFIPAIELIKNQLEVTDLDSGTDYRRIPRALSQVYYHPLDDSTQREMSKLFSSIVSASKESKVVQNRELRIWGRTLIVPESAGDHVARFQFSDLCGKPLSAADYLEVTRVFGTIFVENVQKMGLGEKDLARRFITFIDACYESKTRLFISSEVPIYQIFSDDPESKSSNKPISDHMRMAMDDLGLSADSIGTSSIFTGDEEVFAFARACSRLVQMGSKQWAETARSATEA